MRGHDGVTLHLTFSVMTLSIQLQVGRGEGHVADRAHGRGVTDASSRWSSLHVGGGNHLGGGLLGIERLLARGAGLVIQLGAGLRWVIRRNIGVWRGF